MPTVTAYRRAPLVDPAYVTLPDSAVHLDGEIGARFDRFVHERISGKFAID